MAAPMPNTGKFWPLALLSGGLSGYDEAKQRQQQMDLMRQRSLAEILREKLMVGEQAAWRGQSQYGGPPALAPAFGGYERMGAMDPSGQSQQQADELYRSLNQGYADIKGNPNVQAVPPGGVTPPAGAPLDTSAYNALMNARAQRQSSGDELRGALETNQSFGPEYKMAEAAALNAPRPTKGRGAGGGNPVKFSFTGALWKAAGVTNQQDFNAKVLQTTNPEDRVAWLDNALLEGDQALGRRPYDTEINALVNLAHIPRGNYHPPKFKER